MGTEPASAWGNSGALLAEGAYRDCRPVVIGDVHRLQLAAKALNVAVDIARIEDVAEVALELGRINVNDPQLLPEDLPWGRESAEAANAACHYVRIACELGMSGAIQGICTAPLNKAALQRAAISNPQIGVCAIDRHAGENGLFGYGEEAEKITPAIEKLQADGIDAPGPLPADAAFFLAGRGAYDLIVAIHQD